MDKTQEIKHKSFIKEYIGQSIFAKDTELVDEYCLKVYRILNRYWQNSSKNGFVRYPEGSMDLNYIRIINDNNDPMHCPKIGDIVFWQNEVAIVNKAIPGNNDINIITVNNNKVVKISKSYDEILGRLRPIK